MATIKVNYRKPSDNRLEGSIYYRITHERKVRLIRSGHKVYPYEWDEKHSCIRTSKDSRREEHLRSTHTDIRRDTERLGRIINAYENGGVHFSAKDIADEFMRRSREYTLFNYTERIIASLISGGRVRTAETYRAALNSFRTFRKGKDIMIDSIDADVIQDYETWLRRRGLTPNTISFYARILRAVYNRAVEAGATDDRKPFRHIYTGIDKTVKRALPLETIRRMQALDLSANRTLGFARDMFMMSFYLRGMSFIDMAFLRKKDLRNGYITYRRRKTGRPLTIKWTDEMQKILDRYPAGRSPYLLPIIRENETNERSRYLNTSYNINRSLKKIGEIVGAGIPVTLYVARHSWASAAKSKGIPLSVISEGMGHDSESTTRIYLASLGAAVIDRANSLIIRSIAIKS